MQSRPAGEDEIILYVSFGGAAREVRPRRIQEQWKLAAPP